MRLIYFDIDTLRADHLGCYGYGRSTSPRIDSVAAAGIRFEAAYTSDSPCLPSRTALSTGTFGRRSGVVNHGGRRSEPFPPDRSRGRQDPRWLRTWPSLLRDAGLHTATISTFAERHSAFHWYAGYNEAFNLGTDGMETADQVYEVAADWLRRRASGDDWFLHVHFWDPHTPYRTPSAFTADLGGEAVPAWITEDVVSAQRESTGPHSAREVRGWGTAVTPGQIEEIRSLDDVAALYDGYDLGIRYADEHIGRLLDLLGELGLADEVGVMISSDHGESLGELGVWCDHQTADESTHRVPVILRMPGLDPSTDPGLRYQFDVVATVTELCGGRVPAEWDGISFAAEMRSRAAPPSRDHLVLSCAAWTAQRSVRFGSHLSIRTWHDGYHGYPEMMLFDLAADPHQQNDLASERPDLVARANELLSRWDSEVPVGDGGEDPIQTVVGEGGGLYVRDRLGAYLERLRLTGRSAQADALAHRDVPVGRLD
jgi:arylsulfatase A-like enzyme